MGITMKFRRAYGTDSSEVHDQEEEKTLQDTVEKALLQIERKQYTKALEAKGFPASRIRKYGFAFEGKTVLIG
jgi:Protein of unknown function (DUF1703).